MPEYEKKSPTLSLYSPHLTNSYQLFNLSLLSLTSSSSTVLTRKMKRKARNIYFRVFILFLLLYERKCSSKDFFMWFNQYQKWKTTEDKRMEQEAEK